MHILSVLSMTKIRWDVQDDNADGTDDLVDDNLGCGGRYLYTNVSNHINRVFICLVVFYRIGLDTDSLTIILQNYFMQRGSGANILFHQSGITSGPTLKKIGQ